MNELKTRTCPNCGAPVPSGKYRCEYCGSVFISDEAPNLVYERVDGNIRILETKVVVPEYAICRRKSEDIANYTLRQMREQIADALTSLIEIKQHEDYMTGDLEYRGRIRILEPTFRF